MHIERLETAQTTQIDPPVLSDGIPLHLHPTKIRRRAGYEVSPLPRRALELQQHNPYINSLLTLIGTVSNMREQGEEIISLAGGLPPEKFLRDVVQFRDSPKAQRLIKTIPVSEFEQYAGSAGFLRLRKWLAQEGSQLTQKDITATDILTTPGSQYGISAAILEFCANDGGKVALTPVPTYSAFLEAAEKTSKTPVFGIESDAQGMIPKSLEQTIRKLLKKGIKPGLVYSMVYSNPTGGVMSDKRGKELNEICKKYGIPFVVDYAYYKLQAENQKSREIPKIDYLDENVILLFTGSKRYAPAERVAWAIVPDEVKRKRLQAVKQAQMMHGTTRAEMDFWSFAESGMLNRQDPKVAKRYRQGIDAGMEAITANSDVFKVKKPDSGMFLWVELPKGISTYAHLGDILKKFKIAYSPGVWFQPMQVQLHDGTLIGPPPTDNFMRLCVVTESPRVVKKAIGQLAQAFREIAQQEGVELFRRRGKVVYDHRTGHQKRGTVKVH